jgi:hypothetical protein
MAIHDDPEFDDPARKKLEAAYKKLSRTSRDLGAALGQGRRTPQALSDVRDAASRGSQAVRLARSSRATLRSSTSYATQWDATSRPACVSSTTVT